MSAFHILCLHVCIGLPQKIMQIHQELKFQQYEEIEDLEKLAFP